MKVTVTLPDGGTAEVDASALTLPDGAQLLGPGDAPEGYVPKDFFEAEVKRRAKDTQAIRRELAQDPETARAIFEAAGIPLGDDGRPRVPDVSTAVQTARQKWEAEQLEPVKGSLSRLQESLARQALLAAAKGQVRDEFATPLPGGPSYVETALGSRVRFDPDLGYVVALDERGDPLPSSSPAPGRPYADAAEFVSSFVKSDAGAPLRRPVQSQPGASYRGSTGSAERTYSPDEIKSLAQDPTEYAKHRDAILRQQGG